ncbi:hypothetical protein BOX15_Mlig025228g2, partial [Macrostomum lignano]
SPQPPSPRLQSLGSIEEVAKYLAYLDRHVHSVPRPQFGKRSLGSNGEFRSAAEAARYLSSLRRYLNSMSRPRFG